MGYLQRKVVALLAFLAFVGAYTALRGTGFALEGAAAASYTVAVFGNAFRKRGVSLLAGETAKPVLEILLGHTLFLTGLIFVVGYGVTGRCFSARLVHAASGIQPLWTPVSLGPAAAADSSSFSPRLR